MVQDQLELDPFSGHLFVFCNRRRNMLKILYWDRNGFCLWHKRLEKEKFFWPESADTVITVDPHQLTFLLDGVDIRRVRGHERLCYETVI